MRDKREFDAILQQIDGHHPSEYSRLTGDFDFTRFVLHNISIATLESGRSDSLFVLHVPQLIAGFPESLQSTPIRRTALEDYLVRKLDEAAQRVFHQMSRGHGECRISVARPGQKILPRSSVVMAEDYVEARVMIRLPVVSGAISADEVREIFFLQLPEVVNSALIHCYLDEKELAVFVSAMEDADAIRRDLVARGLVSFVATGSSLNRKVGTDLPAGDTARLEVAPELENTVATPNFGALRGLTIPAGVTLVIGDNYSGRAELIAALAAGIYNHVPGDGRERVISVPDAVYVMADPGRSVQKVDISPFFVKNDDPALRQFTTTSATPAESLMAGVIEALHVGAQTLFFDESTAEPSFLAMDNGLSNLSEAWSGKMVSLSDRVRQIADELRVNVVVGACACSSEFIPVADTVLLIENYRVTDVTKKARELGLARSNRAARCDLPTPNEPVRWVIPSSLDPSLGREDAVIQTFGASRLQFGRTFIDLSSVPQIADDHQTMAIGLLLYHAKLHHLDDSRPVSAILDLLDQDLTQEGMDAITRDLRGDLARPRRFEVAAVLNRMSPLRIMARSDESGKK